MFLNGFNLLYNKNGQNNVGDALDDLYSKIGVFGGSVSVFADLDLLDPQPEEGTIYYVKNDTGVRWWIGFKKKGFYIKTATGWDDAEKYIKYAQISSQIESLWQPLSVAGSSLYPINTIINHNGLLYRNKTGVNTENNPSIDTINWELISDNPITIKTVSSFGGGDFTTINDAINSITDASSTKQYTILCSGTFIENIDLSLKPYIHIRGINPWVFILVGLHKSGVFNSWVNVTFVNTLTLTSTILDATAGSGFCELENCVFDCTVNTDGVIPTLVEFDVDDAFMLPATIIYNNTSSGSPGGTTSLIKFTGNGRYAITSAECRVNTNQTDGDLRLFEVTTNNSFITSNAFNTINSLNVSYNGEVSGIYVNNTGSNEVKSSEYQINGAGIGIGSSIISDGGNSVVTASDCTLKTQGFATNCYSNSVNVGDIVNLSFCSLREDNVECGLGTINKVVRQNGSLVINTAFVDETFLLNNSTTRTLQQILSSGFSAGWIAGNEITDNGDGTVSIASGQGFIRIENDEQAIIKSFDIGGFLNIVLTNNAKNYIYIDYNNGSPIISTTLVQSVVESNGNNIYPLWLVTKEFIDGITTLHITDIRQRAKNFIARSQQKDYAVNGVLFIDGTLSESNDGNRNILGNSGTSWVKNNPYILSSFSTAGTDRYDRYYQTTLGTWAKVVNQTQWDNLYYNSIGTGLVLLNASKYSYQDFYRDYDGDVFSVYGTDEYTLQANAVNAPIPTPPIRTDEHARRFMRIVFQQAGTVPVEVINFTSTTSSSTGFTIPLHNSLSGLNVGDYLHLTLNEYSNLALLNQPNNFTQPQTIQSDLTVNGNAFFNGEKVKVDKKISVGDPIIGLNFGEVGFGVTGNVSGVHVSRGTAIPYVFHFEESSETFRCGTYYLDLNYTGKIGTFALGDEVKGALSGATGYVVQDTGSTLVLYLPIGSFINSETVNNITDGTSSVVVSNSSINDDTQKITTIADDIDITDYGFTWYNKTTQRLENSNFILKSGSDLLFNANMTLGSLSTPYSFRVHGSTELDVMPGYNNEGSLILGQYSSNELKHKIICRNNVDNDLSYMILAPSDGTSSGNKRVLEVYGNGTANVKGIFSINNVKPRYTLAQFHRTGASTTPVDMYIDPSNSIITDIIEHAGTITYIKGGTNSSETLTITYTIYVNGVDQGTYNFITTSSIKAGFNNTLNISVNSGDRITIKVNSNSATSYNFWAKLSMQY